MRRESCRHSITCEFHSPSNDHIKSASAQKVEQFPHSQTSFIRHWWAHQQLTDFLHSFQVEMTGSSIFDYCHAGDHAEIAEQLGLSLSSGGGASGLASPSSAVGSDEGTGSQGTWCHINLRTAAHLWPFSFPFCSCRHNDFELDECLQGLRPCFLHPHEVHADQAGLSLQVVWLQGKLKLVTVICSRLFSLLLRNNKRTLWATVWLSILCLYFATSFVLVCLVLLGKLLRLLLVYTLLVFVLWLKRIDPQCRKLASAAYYFSYDPRTQQYQFIVVKCQLSSSIRNPTHAFILKKSNRSNLVRK